MSRYATSSLSRNVLATLAAQRSAAGIRASPLMSAAVQIQMRTLHAAATRMAANPQSGKPASDSLSHTKQNIKEEVKKVKESLENSIAGGSSQQVDVEVDPKTGGGSGTSEILRDAKSITGEMALAVPRPALLWGGAGLLPYVSTAGASIWLARQQWLVTQGVDKTMDSETASALLLHAQNIQVGYGAVLLSFLGAIHWGFEFSRYGGVKGNQRYAIGVLPFMLGWPTVLLAPQMALIGQWASFVAVWFIDLRATNAGWVPKWYSTYRFWLTFFVGTSIIATLAGTNYYSGERGTTLAGVASKLQEKVEADGPTKRKLKEKSAHGDKGGKVKEGEVRGDVEATQADEDEEGFVKITNKKRE